MTARSNARRTPTVNRPQRRYDAGRVARIASVRRRGPARPVDRLARPPAGAAARDGRRRREVRRRPCGELRAVCAVDLLPRAPVGSPDRLSSGGARPFDGREVPGGGGAVRIHRRRLEHVTQRPVGRLRRRRPGDVDRCPAAVLHRPPANLRDGHVGRCAHRHADRARQQQYRRRHRIQRGIPRQPGSRNRALCGVRDDRYGGFQLHRDAAARSQADVTTSSGRLQRWPHAAAGWRRARGDRVDGAAGHADRTAHVGQCARRSAAGEAAAAGCRIDEPCRDRAPPGGARLRLHRGSRRVTRGEPRTGAVEAIRRQEGARARARRRGCRSADAG